ncbi:monooxygenase FAD-binding protein [Fusarium tjaetaba]|uniref:Monooxygenase FAD-binding protein n=1 Tax=Fusarium tjaetaba TaxID=1567544 RepID=A0A8H5QZT6_9HYPO|nr:monooxygenase FAD-binding protein [Fusarium tjaetaba]KAF5625331.1 monooxygenase FAD-binding protein [Fusarium tjaetaba]
MTDQKPKPIRVAIIGAGPGGLVLAQILRQDPRFSVTVYERGVRDGSGTSSLVGFRILVSPSILDDLRSQLPAPVATLIDDAIGITQAQGNRVAFMDEKCGLICRLDVQQSRDMCSVSRWKLREALMHGAEDIVEFGKQFSSYEQLGGESGDVKVKVHFADGDEIECDVLVGADGAGSKVRKLLLPNSQRSASGLTVVYFKAPFTPETEAMIPWKSGCVAMTPRRSMVVAYYKDRQRPYGPYDLEKIDPADSFLMFGLGCYTNEFENQSKHPDEMTPEELKDECLARAKNWNPLLRALIALSVPSSVFVSHVKTQDPIKPWESGRVTLLGDAAHSMTPYLGKGASSAIIDAMSLAKALKSEPKQGQGDFLKAQLSIYEEEMLKHGFEASRQSMVAQKFTFNAGDTPWKCWWRNLALKAWDWWMSHPPAMEEDFPVSYSEMKKGV